jgi:hypothetical protein
VVAVVVVAILLHLVQYRVEQVAVEQDKGQPLVLLELLILVVAVALVIIPQPTDMQAALALSSLKYLTT